MRPQLLCCTATALTFFLLCFVRSGNSQLLGCDAPGMQCPTKSNASDAGVCSYNDHGVGSVLFDSNITSDGPLSVTVTVDDFDGRKPNLWRSFWLGTPSTLDLRTETRFGGCSFALNSFRDQLQAQSDDLANFGCDMIMGPDCASDIVSRMREVLDSADTAADDGIASRIPCVILTQSLGGLPLPESCRRTPSTKPFSFGPPQLVVDGLPTDYEEQEGCSISPGGAEYNMARVAYAHTAPLFPEDQVNSSQLELFKTEVSSLVTVFYNEPWNPDSTGPLEALIDEPEINLTCLKALPEPGQQSGAISVRVGLRLGHLALCLGAMVLTSVVV